METRSPNEQSVKSSSSTVTFKNLDGKIIDDPRETIKQLSRYLVPRSLDYRAWDASSEIGVAEVWGQRKTQEDRLAFGTIKNVESGVIQLAEWTSIIEETLDFIQNSITELGYSYCGSTYCAAIIDGKTGMVHTSIVGDSSAYVCAIENEKVVEFRRLNSEIHNPSEPNERNRLNDPYGHKVRDHRLNGELAVSRALGDNHYELFGLIHKPTCDIDQFLVSPTRKYFIIVACDGLTERQYLTNEKISQLIEQYQNAPSDEIATQLACAAEIAGSQDNISVGVAKIDDQLKYLAVFDGHSGSVVSEFASAVFDEVLHSTIQHRKLQNRLNQPSIDPIISKQLSVIHLDDIYQLILKLLKVKIDKYYWADQDGAEKFVINTLHQLHHIYGFLLNNINQDIIAECSAETNSIQSFRFFSNLLVLPIYASSFHQKYCQTYGIKKHFLENPIGLIAHLFDTISSATALIKKNDLDGLKTLYRAYDQLVQESHPLYQVARIIFNIRRHFPELMETEEPTSLEKFIEKMFEEYPTKSISLLLKEILNALELEKEEKAKNKSVLYFFHYANPLKKRIELAITEISLIYETLSKLTYKPI